jgi:ankyrin repeat protein
MIALITVLSTFAVPVTADGWDDFTNNLATDLAPLISLFGEQTTKQFLSESISFLDNIIFAMAPLGILTAVVSVIRVLGSASLKAFVGRAQEGRGVAEAELCSSTSDDVCELWNSGGIARVFGRPKIVEFIFDLKREDSNVHTFYELQCEGAQHVTPPMAGIYRPKEYESLTIGNGKPVQNYGQNWFAACFRGLRKMPVLSAHQSQDPEHSKVDFAPNPNLYLNVGIQKNPRYVLRIAAVFGCVVQASVLLYGAWAVYIKGLHKDGQRASHPYFWLMISGTLLLVKGMFLCCWLINQSTQEKTIPVAKRIFWLQPGSQTVGEQNFEAFAYSAELDEYTTSWKKKRMSSISKIAVWVAICTSLTGFVLQFTGLRGLHSSVALYQFAATLVMAFVRSLLRTKRLNEEKNVLGRQNDQEFIEGHELDWQSLELEHSSCQGTGGQQGRCPLWKVPTSWSIGSDPLKLTTNTFPTMADIEMNRDATVAGAISRASESSSSADTGGASLLLEWIMGQERVQSPHLSKLNLPEDHPNLARRLLSYRSRLSYLTHAGAPTTSQQWNSEVRKQAVKLQTAIQSAASYAFSSSCTYLAENWQNCNAFCWALPCLVRGYGAFDESIPLYLTVICRRGQWIIDLSSVEATLGLWAWSLKKVLKQKGCADDRRLSKKVVAVTTVSHGRSQSGVEEQLRLWVLRQPRRFEYDEAIGARVVNHNNLQQERSQRTQFISDSATRKHPGEDNTQCKLEPQPSSSSSSLSIPLWTELLFSASGRRKREGKLLSIQTENSLLTMVAQDIFTSFIDALASISKQLEGASIVRSIQNDVRSDVISSTQRQQFLGLSNNFTDRLSDIFIEAALGSREDALLSVIPPFHARSLLPSLAKERDGLIQTAKDLRKEGRWTEAEDILIVLSLSGMKSAEESLELPTTELCELYRKAMRSEDVSSRQFGYLGICEFINNFQSANVETLKIRYQWVVREYARLHSAQHHVRLKPLGAQDTWCSTEGLTFAAAMQLQSDHPIGLVLAELFKKEIAAHLRTEPPILVWAVKNGCHELVDDLLEAMVDVEVKDKQGRTALAYACEKGYECLVKWLLDAGASTSADSDGYTPVECAAKHGHAAILKHLIKAHAYLESRDKTHRTPLSWAAERGHYAVVKLLLETRKVDINTKDEPHQRTPLLWAAEHGHDAIVKLLLETHVVDLNAKDTQYQRTPLSWAAERGHYAVVKLLLETSKVDINTKDEPYQRTPLLWAAEHGHDAVVELLLETHEADLNAKDREYQRTPLSWAAERGHYAVVKLLLETSKVDINTKDEPYQRTPLLWAAEHGHDAIVKILLETREVDLNAKDGQYSRTPLLWAAERGHDAVIKLLLETYNINLNAKEERDEQHDSTPLSWTANHEHHGVMQLPVAEGAGVQTEDELVKTPALLPTQKDLERVAKLPFDPEVCIESTDQNLQTPLSLAAANGHLKAVELLLKRGANIEARDKNGRTPLSLAAGKAQVAVVKLLLDTGAALESRDHDGWTPMSWASLYKFKGVVDLLSDRGAKILNMATHVAVDVMCGTQRRLEDGKLMVISPGKLPSWGTQQGHELLNSLEVGDARLQERDGYAQSPLIWAAENSDEATVEMLISKGASLESLDQHGQTPLSLAAERGNIQVLGTILGMSPDLESMDYYQGRTPLSWAANNGDEAVVNLLLKCGANCEAMDKLGRTPLFWAAWYRHESVARQLLAKGAVPKHMDHIGRTSLFYALQSESTAVVKLLLDDAAGMGLAAKYERAMTEMVPWFITDAEAWKLYYNSIALSWAVNNGDEAIVQLFTDEGSYLAGETVHGRIPLWINAKLGLSMAVEVLLELGADTESKDEIEGRTALSWAAGQGNETVVELLLGKGANLEARDKLGRTPLSWAAGHGYVSVVNLLLEKGADLESKDLIGRTPLTWTAQNGYKTTFMLLLDRGAKMENQRKYNRSLLLWAAGHGKMSAMEQLLDEGFNAEFGGTARQIRVSWATETGQKEIQNLLGDDDADKEMRDEHGQTPLLWAADNGHESLVELLLRHGADPESKDKHGQTSLSLAAEKGHSRVTEMLLMHAANPESNDGYWGRTPLSWAAGNGNEAVVKLLLDKGANTNTRDKYHGRTPLLWASEHGHDAVVQLLLEKDADSAVKDEYQHRTPLSWAAGNGHIGTATLLLEYGADLHSKDRWNRTSLMWATEKGHERVVELLLGHGEDLDCKDSTCRTPLLRAAENGNESMVKLLLGHGANTESKESHGQTALSLAAENGHVTVVQLLLGHGADIESKDRCQGRTPLSWAAANGHEAVVRLLYERGANLEARDIRRGRTSLSWAAENGHEMVVKLLLAKGADSDTADNSNRTPLSWAVRRRQTVVVKMLLEEGIKLGEMRDN